VQNIYCDDTRANKGQGHFLGRISGANLELWCAKCRAWHTISVVDVVRGMEIEFRNGHEPEGERAL